jgi:hypothetical protein
MGLADELADVGAGEEAYDGSRGVLICNFRSSQAVFPMCLLIAAFLKYGQWVTAGV